METRILTKVTIRIDAELARLIRHLAVDHEQSFEEMCNQLMREGYEQGLLARPNAKGDSST